MLGLIGGFPMRSLLILLSWCIASMAYSQTPNKPVPPVPGKAEAGHKKDNPPAPKQEITVTLPSSLNLNLGGKLDVKSETQQTGANHETNKWTDPITLFTFALVVANILLWLSTRNIGDAVLTEIRQGFRRLHCYGHVDYLDADGRFRKTAFCRVWVPPVGVGSFSEPGRLILENDPDYEYQD